MGRERISERWPQQRMSRRVSKRSPTSADPTGKRATISRKADAKKNVKSRERSRTHGMKPTRGHGAMTEEASGSEQEEDENEDRQDDEEDFESPLHLLDQAGTPVQHSSNMYGHQ